MLELWVISRRSGEERMEARDCPEVPVFHHACVSTSLWPTSSQASSTASPWGVPHQHCQATALYRGNGGTPTSWSGQGVSWGKWRAGGTTGAQPVSIFKTIRVGVVFCDRYYKMLILDKYTTVLFTSLALLISVHLVVLQAGGISCS